jgi:hypothetical protein
MKASASIFRVEVGEQGDVSNFNLEDGGSAVSETLVTNHRATRRKNQETTISIKFIVQKYRKLYFIASCACTSLVTFNT